MSVARKSNNSSTWADRNNWSAAEITGLAETRQDGSRGTTQHRYSYILIWEADHG